MQGGLRKNNFLRDESRVELAQTLPSDERKGTK